MFWTEQKFKSSWRFKLIECTKTEIKPKEDTYLAAIQKKVDFDVKRLDLNLQLKSLAANFTNFFVQFWHIFIFARTISCEIDCEMNKAGKSAI